tara:strand:- start:24524 stop:25648 length:1125 start_codon:yes stop_codon:yes gene_type:complete
MNKKKDGIENKKLKLGIIGFGGFGRFIYQALFSNSSFCVTAIADNKIDESVIPDEIQFFRNWEHLCSNADVDAILISTPPSSHSNIALHFLKRGKHVMVEKPIAVSLRDAKEILKVAEENNCVVMVDFMQRFNPILESIQSLHSKNLFGDFERYFVENYAQDETLPLNHWFWDQSISGGILVEHAVHFIDIVHWFSNSPKIKKVDGYTDSRNQFQMDKMSINVQYENGLLATHIHSFSRPNIFERTNMRFIFSTAQFDLKGWIPQEGNFVLLGNDRLAEELSILPNFAITDQRKVNSIPVRGKLYNYDRIIEGNFKAELSKSELYSQALQKIFNDFHTKIINRAHINRVSISDALKAVEVAEIATQTASATFQY